MALGWEPEHLHEVLKGRPLQPGDHAVPDLAAVWSRLDSFDLRLSEIAKLPAELKVRDRHGD
jgi:hypothetical protein